jgi:putative transposase
MKYDREKHHRKSIRLRGYDYASAGAYFITICTHQRQCLFGQVINGAMQLSNYGTIAATEWVRSADLRQEIELGEWIVMPNHFHGIVFIHEIHEERAQSLAPLQGNRQEYTQGYQAKTGIAVRKPKSLSSLVAGFKMAVTIQINGDRQTPRNPVWQRNYYDYIIRDEIILEKIYEYVLNNPLSWKQDQLHPDNPSKW